MCSEEAATFPTDKLEPYLFSQDVKADLLFMQASNDDKVNILSFVPTIIASSTKPNESFLLVYFGFGFV